MPFSNEFLKQITIVQSAELLIHMLGVTEDELKLHNLTIKEFLINLITECCITIYLIIVDNYRPNVRYAGDNFDLFLYKLENRVNVYSVFNKYFMIPGTTINCPNSKIIQFEQDVKLDVIEVSNITMTYSYYIKEDL